MLSGFVTERDLQAIEDAFPGIWRFYLDLVDKPRTFLDLMWRFGCQCPPASHSAASPSSDESSCRLR